MAPVTLIASEDKTEKICALPTDDVPIASALPELVLSWNLAKPDVVTFKLLVAMAKSRRSIFPVPDIRFTVLLFKLPDPVVLIVPALPAVIVALVPETTLLIEMLFDAPPAVVMFKLPPDSVLIVKSP